MTELTLVLFVDALRHDYVAHMPYLRALAERGQVGRLREDVGFMPRASYFGGLTPEQFGFTNMFCYDPPASPFGVARGLPSSAAGHRIEAPLGLRQFIDAEARKRVTPYAARYLSSAEIPIDLLADFDIVDKRPPWDRRAGYRSVFHEMDDLGLPYFTCAWPCSTALADASDPGILAESLQHIQPPCRLAFVHLQQLDATGHQFGPESPEILASLAEVDRLIAQLLTGLEARYDEVSLVLFGDHGMVSVTGTTDVWAALETAGLKLGRELVGFLDSTMARFWFGEPAARERVRRALMPLKGRILDEPELTQLDLAGCDPRNGEMIFLADAGVLISPNFFQRRGSALRGMHGYHPDCPDNQAFFLVRDAGADRRIELGVVRPTRIHTEIRRQLGLPASVVAMPDPAGASEAAPVRLPGAFTQDRGRDAHEMIQRHLSRLVEEVRRVSPETTSVLLNGSFGRDEGGIARDPDGTPRPVNDYDLLVVTPNGGDSQSSTWRDLGSRLAREFGTDFVHFNVTSNLGVVLPRTLSNFDVRHGSRVLLGRPDLLDTLPPFAAGEIPLHDGLQLLMNRMAGILTVVGWPGSPAPGDRGRHRYLTNQVMKALMALGDWHLLRARAYACSYQTRRDRIHWLGPGLRIAPDEIKAIQLAYQYKLHPDSVVPSDVMRLAARALEWLVATFTAGVAELTNVPVTTPSEAAAAYYEFTTADADQVACDNAYVHKTLQDNDVAAIVDTPIGSVRQHIYASLPLLAAASTGDAAAFADATRRMAGCFSAPWPDRLTPAQWEAARERVSHIWLTIVH